MHFRSSLLALAVLLISNGSGRADWSIETIAVETGRLDDVFRTLTTKDASKDSNNKVAEPVGGAA